MNIRLIGTTLVIVGCSFFGFQLAANLRYEIRTIRELIDILNYMECELNYRLTPLPQLCRTSADRGCLLKRLLIRFAEEIESQVFPDTATCMNATITGHLDLPDTVKSCLMELGSSFGIFDLEGQLSGIVCVRQKCAKRLEELESNKDIRIRNYQTLGLCAGAALAILLF